MPNTLSSTRRVFLQAGATGLLGLDQGSTQAWQAAGTPTGKAKSVLFVFLSGGLSQLDSFDMKPNAPVETRGEFSPVMTSTPGVHVCEYLPQIAQQSAHWSLVRSFTHRSNEHNAAHTLMLTGRSMLPPGWQEKKPQATDWPSITATTPRQLAPTMAR